jgi:hypothetical protein
MAMLHGSLRYARLLCFLVSLAPLGSTYALFGTIVTPFEYRVRLMHGQQPLVGYAVALHRADAGAEPDWPWRHRYLTDSDGRLQPVEFSQSGSVTVLTKRIDKARVLIALRPKSGGVEYRAIDLFVGSTTSVNVLRTSSTELPAFKLLDYSFNTKHQESTDWPAVSAVVTKAEFGDKPGWKVDLTIDLGLKSSDYH